MTRYERRIRRVLLSFTAGFLLFLLLLTFAEQQGLSRAWLGPIFIFATIMMYAVIGIRSRTTDPEEYYVAGRRIPAMYNGMAAAADWMSAASFISLAGGLYLQGYGGTQVQAGGLAYVLGWTGGFCLLALLIAPHLRRLNLYTVPDYFDLRFGGRGPRIIAALSAVLCSFVYVVAQIYGVGLIASRLTGVQFEIGILLGIGGVLLCSFLGGMKAITWTQVAQYVVMLLAFLIPVSWLAYRQLGEPAAPFVYGSQLQKIRALEEKIERDPAERQVGAIFLARGREYEALLHDLPGSLARVRSEAQAKLRALKQQNADPADIQLAARALHAVPRDPAAAREQWTRAMNESYERARPLGGAPRHSRPFAGDPDGTPQERDEFDLSRRNFLALMFCLMMGTAGLPHLLTRYYTTPSVAATRSSVAWSLFFIVLVYISAPAVAALVKFEVMNNLVGSSVDSLPAWVAQWARVDPTLVSVADVNGDHILQWGEIRLGADMIMLATPELGGLPYVISGLVAAGGLAAALSTADGLLLTISNALVRDMFCHDLRPGLGPEQRVILSKFALMGVALVAAVVASARPAGILLLVSAAFSLAAAAFVPAMVLGMLWRGANRAGAVAGMLAGLGITIYYMAANAPVVRGVLGVSSAPQLWFGIQPISAGVFGVPLGFAVTGLASLLTRSRAST